MGDSTLPVMLFAVGKIGWKLGIYQIVNFLKKVNTRKFSHIKTRKARKEKEEKKESRPFVSRPSNLTQLCDFLFSNTLGYSLWDMIIMKIQGGDHWSMWLSFDLLNYLGKIFRD